MKFNQYIWNLYKESYEGQLTIRFFEESASKMSEMNLIKKYNPYLSNILNDQIAADTFETLWSYGVSEYQEIEIDSLEKAKSVYVDLISCGIFINGEEYIRYNSFDTMLEMNTILSILLFYLKPEYYFPNLFVCQFFELIKISDAFDIELPPIPKKKDFKSRCMYYWDLCVLFYEFRKEHSISPCELCAFLYDFATNIVKKRSPQIMPKPSQAWFIGGIINSEDRLNKTFWQANKETRMGDILLHYETAPKSAITRIWIAQTDGVVDPFFYYYSNTYIDRGIEIPDISLKDLKSDIYFSSHPLIKKNFQGVNGWQMSAKDYSEIIRILKSKQVDTNKLPNIHVPDLDINASINSEKDVESYLVEPLLSKLNLPFYRQIPIKAGRGHRIFPDYGLFYNQEKETAKIIIEAKYHFKNNRDIQDCFMQAKSYAKILESSIFIICDRECLFIFPKKESFDRSLYEKFYWGEINTPDVFNRLKKILSC